MASCIRQGRFSGKLKMRWSTLEDYAPEARQKVVRWKDDMKSSKKALSATYKALKSTVAGGDFPDEQALAAFREASRRFAAFADPEWQEAMDEYMDHLDNLERAVKDRQREVLEHEMRDVQARMKACHKAYK